METILVGRVLLAENLDRNLATEFDVFGKIDFAHPAGAQLLQNSIV
jgi:hypothetical protein